MSAPTMEVTERSAAPKGESSENGRSTLWQAYLLVVIGTVAAALVPLIFDDRFYFYDDSQTGAMGNWYQFGRAILEGKLRYLDLTTWGSGNLFVEGQWGLLNPVMWVVSIGAALAPGLSIYIGGVKVLLLVVAATGTTTLVRSLGANPWVAAICGIVVPLNGFTVYMDAPSWVTGLFAWAWFPWLWWAIMRMTSGVGGLIPVAAFGYLIVSNGYFHGTLMVFVLLASYLVESVVRRRWISTTHLTLAGVFVAACAIVVFLPALLTAPVTRRAGSGITSSGFLGPDAGDLLNAAASAAGAELPFWGGAVLTIPLFYMAWILPGLLVGSKQRVLRHPASAAIALFTAVAAAFMLGPTEVGPLRFPARVFPYVVLGLMVLVSVGKGRLVLDNPQRPPQQWVPLVIGLPALGAWLTFSDLPSHWRHQALALIVTVTALLAIALLDRLRAAMRIVAVVALTVTLGVTVAQRWWSPSPFLPDFGLPGTTAELQTPLPGAAGQTFIVGNFAGGPGSRIWEESSLANAWKVNPRSVQNSYVVIGFQAYNDLLQMNYLGLTEPTTLDALLAVDERTGMPLSDELGIQNIQIWRHTLTDRDLGSPPDGWRLAETREFTVLWTREEQVPAVGQPVFVSDPAEARVLQNTDDSITLRVTNRGQGDATIILSRLAWPGYRVSGPAALGDPHRDFLLTLTVPPGTDDAEIVVTFRPPGLTAGLLGLGLAAALILLGEVARRRGWWASPRRVAA